MFSSSIQREREGGGREGRREEGREGGQSTARELFFPHSLSITNKKHQGAG